ncbi:MAG: sensor histidine kinase [Lachnospiraceae bacterium]|nr:sensor histidine kinase [Lachnospiraceae bacterium]
MAQILHKDRWLKKLFVSVLSVIAVSVAELVFMGIMPREEAVSGELMQTHPVAVYSLYIFVSLVIVTVTVLVERIVIRKINRQSLNWHWLLFLAFPISQLFTFYVFFRNYTSLEMSYSSVQLIAAVVVYLLADAALIFSIRISERNASMRVRNEILEEQISAQKQYYSQLAESYENIRKMRHDIDNHLYTMQVLLEKGQVEEASSYAKILMETDTAGIIFPGCDNHVISSFLMKKKEDFEKAGVKLELEISLPLDTGVSNPDIICALGNILDNALDECKEMDEAQVRLKTGFKNPYLSIWSTNPVKDAEGKRAEKKRRIPEMDRGLGMSILKDLADKYDGRLEAGLKENRYETSLILKGVKEKESEGDSRC